MSITKRNFLIVTDDANMGQSVQNYFGKDPTTDMCFVKSLSQALDCIIKRVFCLLLVDLQLSGVDKTEIVRIFRVVKHIPILALTDALSTDERIMLYQAGVSAFIEKPIDLSICLAQANALVDIYAKPDDTQNEDVSVIFGTTIIIRPRYRQVFIDGERLKLTRREFDLLYFFAKHPGQVFSRKQLYEQVWDEFYELGGEETVKSHIKTLRRKLSMLDKRVIENMRGVGYRFVPPE